MHAGPPQDEDDLVFARDDPEPDAHGLVGPDGLARIGTDQHDNRGLFTDGWWWPGAPRQIACDRGAPRVPRGGTSARGVWGAPGAPQYINSVRRTGRCR